MLIKGLNRGFQFHSVIAYSATMRLFTGQYVLILALLSLYAVNSVNGGIVKREETDKSISDPPGSGGPETSSLQKLLQGLISIFIQIPIIGNFLADILEKGVELVLALEFLSNGAVARMLGGTLPCEVSLDNGFECSGITKNGGLIQLLENVVDKLPELLVPVMIKDILKMILRGVVAPSMDVLMGGLPDIKTP